MNGNPVHPIPRPEFSPHAMMCRPTAHISSTLISIFMSASPPYSSCSDGVDIGGNGDVVVSVLKWWYSRANFLIFDFLSERVELIDLVARLLLLLRHDVCKL